MKRGLRTRHWLEVSDRPGQKIVIPNTVLLVGAQEEAKRCWNFGTHAPWSKLVISSSLAAIDRLSTGLNPEDVVKDVANLLVIDNFVSFDVSFALAEANFTWNRIGIKNANGIYLLIGSIPSPGFTKTSSQTVQYFSQLEYEV